LYEHLFAVGIHSKSKVDFFSQGHEGCGEIIQIGEGVTDKRFKLVGVPLADIEISLILKLRETVWLSLLFRDVG
jgi:hypothetical protein